jgi:hypothetical protein
MNRDQKKHLSREKRRLQREQRARLEKELDDLEPEMDDNELPIPEEEIKALQKDYHGSWQAKSFSELDFEMDAQEKGERVSETSMMVQDLVRNIVQEPEFSPEEKSAAIKSVADEFGQRVRMIMESPMMHKEATDIDALVLEATQARDKRIISSSEGIKGMVSKTVRVAAKKLGIDMPPEKDTSAVQIEKDANGDWRAVMWVSNNFIDWDGDIISEDAHKEYVDWVNKNKDCMPAFVTWHTPGTVRENPVDYMDYFNGFLVASAKLTEAEAIGLLKAQNKTNIGMSHGSFALARDPQDPRVITKYRMYEVSDLPLSKAANPFTDFETISKEVGMDKKEYLTALLGDADKAEAFLEKTGLKQKALQDAEIESKEKTEEVPVVTEPVVEPPAIEPVVETKKEAIPDLVAQVMKELDIDGLNAFVTEAKTAMDKVSILEALVKEMTINQDEKLADMIAPPITKTMAWSRPSEEKDNIIKKSDPLTKTVAGLPDGYWLSEATKTAPILETV